MTISSRTPEGDRFRCDICANEFCISRSVFPVRDTTCPHCGCLKLVEVWEPSTPDVLCSHSTTQFERQLGWLIETANAGLWIAISVFVLIAVYTDAGTLIWGVLWAFFVLAYGLYLLPMLESRLGNKPDYGKMFWVGVLLGWGLVPGVPIGILMGAVVASNELGWSPSHGAFAGLLCGPLVTGALGISLVFALDLVVRLLTGHSLAEMPH